MVHSCCPRNSERRANVRGSQDLSLPREVDYTVLALRGNLRVFAEQLLHDCHRVLYRCLWGRAGKMRQKMYESAAYDIQAGR
jgi:fido (protein-threonine AMPylation protein)